MIWQWIVATIIALIVTPIAAIVIFVGGLVANAAWDDFMLDHPRIGACVMWMGASVVFVGITGAIFKAIFGGGA